MDQKAANRDRLLELLEPIHDDARALARRIARSDDDGDDVFHDAVLRALYKLDSLRDEHAFPLWFYRILCSVHRSRSRRGFWRRLSPLEDEHTPEPVGEDGQRWEDDRHAANRVRRALAALAPPQREAFVLFELQGYSLEEIAAIQNRSLSAVKSRLSRARDRLRRHYERMGIAADRAPDADADAATGHPRSVFRQEVHHDLPPVSA